MAASKYTLLEMMMEDMQAAPELYQPTHFWRKGVDEILNDIRENGVENFRSLTSALRFFVPTYGYPGYHLKPEIYRDVHETLREVSACPPKLQTRLSNLLSGKLQALADYRVYLASESGSPPHTELSTESMIGAPLEQFEFDGRRFSRSFLNYLLGLNFLKSTCETEGIRTILEIGGGYGSLGEILLSDPANGCFYIDVDIPPTAFVATYYLQARFGRKTVGDYETLRARSSLSLDELRHEFSAIVLCPWQLPKLEGVMDLFVNYISFQEMEPRVVENYLQHVRRLSARYILLRNLREGKQLAKGNSNVGVRKPILGQDYDRFLAGYDLIATNTKPFGFETEDGFHSELRLYRQNGFKMQRRNK